MGTEYTPAQARDIAIYVGNGHGGHSGRQALLSLADQVEALEAQLAAVGAAWCGWQLCLAHTSAPFAWATFDGEGSYELRLYVDNESYPDTFIARNGLNYANWVIPLYAR